MTESLDLASLALETRGPLPEEYRWLLARYPREVWRAHPNMGGHTRFWLMIHGDFRRAADRVDGLVETFREGGMDADGFRRAMAPRLQGFLGALEHHHQIEDHVFFPRFAAAEARVAKGIELLESDHVAIDGAIHGTVDAANVLLRARERDAMLHAADGFNAQVGGLTRLMRKHLDDEEEIIMPLVLDRGEAALGVEGW